MKLWRISNYPDLKGIGGLRSPGRWHNRGIPVVYLSESPALAMLEVLVHFEMAPEDVPDDYQLLEVEYSGRKGISRLSDNALEENWQKSEVLTRMIGDEWLMSFKCPLLKVPSALVPNSYNYILNPRHELMSNARIVDVITHPFDRRLYKAQIMDKK